MSPRESSQTPNSGVTSGEPTVDAGNRRADQIAAGAPGANPAESATRTARKYLAWFDQLARHAALLSGTTVITAGLGFLFWLIASRRFPADVVGVAATAMLAVNFLSYLAMLGLNVTVMRHIDPGPRRHGQVSQATVMVAAAGAVLATSYVWVAPILAPPLAAIRENHWYAGLFVAVTVLAATTLLHGAVFVGLRRPQLYLGIHGVLQGVVKVLAVLLVPAAGSLALFSASALSTTAAAVMCVGALSVACQVQWQINRRPAWLARERRYSAGSYAASVFHIAPLLVVPLVLMAQRPASDLGYYTVAVQLATMVHSLGLSIADAAVPQSAQSADVRATQRRALRIMCVVMLPAAAILALANNVLLSWFGKSYDTHAGTLLVALSCATVGYISYYWGNMLLRISGQVLGMAMANLVYAALAIAGVTVVAKQDLWLTGAVWGVAAFVSGALCWVIWRLGAHEATERPRS